jgi:hypothetical protein
MGILRAIFGGSRSVIDVTAYRRMLAEIAALLSKARQSEYADSIRMALEKDDADVRRFLKSNTLWGGAGSIADSAVVNDELAAAIVRLGKSQIQDKMRNSRTEMWTEAFEKRLAKLRR